MEKKKLLTDFEKGKIVTLKESVWGNRENDYNISRSSSVFDNFIKRVRIMERRGNKDDLIL